MNRPVHGGNIAWAAALAGCPASLILDFSASINPFGPPKSAIAAIEKGLKALTAYPDPNYSQLRSSLAQWLKISPDWVLPGNGSAELLTWAGRELSQLEITCLLTPAFGDYWRVLKSFEAKIQAFPLDLELGVRSQELGVRSQESGVRSQELGVRSQELGVRSQESGVRSQELEELSPPSPFPFPPSPFPSKGLILNNPHNPTGKLWTVAEILPYLKKFALVVVDEAFMDFLPPKEQQSLITSIEEFPNLVILRSLTKFYSLPGLRIGYAIAHPDRLQRWQKWRDPWTVNVLAEAAAIAVIEDREFQQQTWEWLPKARSQLFEGLASIPGYQPLESAANFLLVKTEQPSSLLQEKLLKNHRILIRDCLSFPELGDRYFRIAVRSQEDNQRLLEALNEF